MSIQKTLSIIKPDGVQKDIIGEIYSRFERAGLKIIAVKRLTLSVSQARAFYDVHKDRPFFNDLVDFMVSGPIVAQVLEGNNAIVVNRGLMGDTNPLTADVGTIRSDFAESIESNIVHGSDSLETSQIEISFFFSGIEMIG